MAKGKNKRNFFLVFMMTMAIIYVTRMVLIHVIGSKGVAFFSAANELYFLFAFAASYGIEAGIGYLVENRNSRQMYSNAKAVFRIGILGAFVLGLVLCVIAFVLNGFLANVCFNVPKANISLYLILPALVFTLITGAFRGYFNGAGLRNMTKLSYIVFGVGYLICTICFSLIFLGIGEKVAGLLRLEDYQYVYGAMGAVIGICVAAFISLIHSLVVFFVYSRRSMFDDDRDYSKTYESLTSILMSILKSGMFEFATLGGFFLVSFANSIGMLKNANVEGIILTNFGEYYGKVLPLIVLSILVISFTSYSYVRKSVNALNREEYRSSRERLERLIHRCSTLGFFVSAMMVALGGDILNIIFKTNNEFTFNAIMIVSLSVVFGLFAVIMVKILCMLHYTGLTGIICTVAAVVDAILCFVFAALFGTTGVMFCIPIYLFIVAAVCFMFVNRAFQYTQEWFRSFLVSIIAALASAIIGLLINKAILNIASSLIAFIISLLFSIVIYMLVLLILRGYYAEELQESFWGRLMLMLGRMTGFM